ncbi:hypothetical protein [Leifsonia aquatica]|uniref:hypothetical protein n=1 Tax=Leifsonia aquatica TaxID=144185 RepID=UPI003820026D
MTDRTTSPCTSGTARARLTAAGRGLAAAAGLAVATIAWFECRTLLGFLLSAALNAGLKPVAEAVLTTALDIPVLAALVLAAIRVARAPHGWGYPAERPIISTGLALYLTVAAAVIALGVLRDAAADIRRFVSAATSPALALCLVLALCGVLVFVGVVRWVHRLVMSMLSPAAAHAAAAAASAARLADRGLVDEYGWSAVRDARKALPIDAAVDALRDTLERTRGHYVSLSDVHRARHEAEHAVVAHATGAVLVSADIQQTNGQGGQTHSLPSLEHGPEQQLRAAIATYVAPIRTALAAGDIGGHSDDLQRAIVAAHNLRILVGADAGTVEEIIHRATVETSAILDQHEQAVDTLASELVKNRQLDGRDIVRIITEAAAESPATPTRHGVEPERHALHDVTL